MSEQRPWGLPLDKALLVSLLVTLQQVAAGSCMSKRTGGNLAEEEGSEDAIESLISRACQKSRLKDRLEMQWSSGFR